MRKLTLSFLLCTFVFSAFSQEDTTAPKTEPADSLLPAPVKPRSYFSASLGFLSNSVYNGRKDSSATPYITPMIGYYHKSGLFVDASMSYLAKSGSSRVDLFNIEAGYDFSLGNFDGELSANKSFYNNSSSNVKSEITGSVFFTGGYDLSFIKPSFEAGINFGTQSDYLLAVGLEHTFYLADDKLQITPGILGNGSTQNYYNSYYRNRKVARKRKTGNVVYDVTTLVEDASKFKMLDYEISVPVSYRFNKLTLSLTPVYAVPFNPAQVTTTLVPEAGGTGKTKTVQETISNSFYCSFGLSYKF
jgi:hypothetical protein